MLEEADAEEEEKNETIVYVDSEAETDEYSSESDGFEVEVDG